jgi:dephospho-CoA kinase
VRPRKVVAITGSIGTGKSLVGEILKKRGYPVLDTDALVHQLFDSSVELQQQIASRFGNAVIRQEGGVDRQALGKIVFDDPSARHDLERLVHPAVVQEVDRQLSLLQTEVAFVLVPLLFEARVDARYDEAWTVTADETVLRERLRQNRGMTDEQINKRLAAQLPQAEKAKRSQEVIDNSGTISDTEQRVDAILQRLKIH